MSQYLPRYGTPSSSGPDRHKEPLRLSAAAHLPCRAQNGPSARYTVGTPSTPIELPKLRPPCKYGGSEWAGQDSNLRPTDYEIEGYRRQRVATAHSQVRSVRAGDRLPGEFGVRLGVRVLGLTLRPNPRPSRRDAGPRTSLAQRGWSLPTSSRSNPTSQRCRRSLCS